MMLRHLLFDTLYRLGRPIWDTPPPEELRGAIEGPDALPPGHALDVGCGTSPNVAYLAQHGWQATGVDFSAAAIRKARHQANGIDGATFIEGDVTKLSQLPISRPITLVIDMGTYHSLPDNAKPTYVDELAAVMEPSEAIDDVARHPNQTRRNPASLRPRLHHRTHQTQRLHHQTKSAAPQDHRPLVLATPTLN
jgi:SAM-dependent methyltransferase